MARGKLRCTACRLDPLPAGRRLAGAQPADAERTPPIQRVSDEPRFGGAWQRGGARAALSLFREVEPGARAPLSGVVTLLRSWFRTGERFHGYSSPRWRRRQRREAVRCVARGIRTVDDA